MQRVLLAAVSSNGCIGSSGKLPWGKLSEDLKRFKAQTTGHAVLMGRKTYESIGKPLPNRLNIVVTRKWNSPLLCQVHPDLVFCRDLEWAYKFAARGRSLFVIGGAEIYRQCLPWIDEMHLTVLAEEYNGEAFFPEWPMSDDWSVVTKEAGLKPPNVQYVIYRRIK